MAGDTRTLNVRWLGDASSLVKSTKTAERAVTSSSSKMTGAGAGVGSAFGKLGKALGAFNLPFAGAASSVERDMGKMKGAGVGMGGAMAGAVTAGIGIAAAAAVDFARKSVDAAAEFNHAHEQLAVVVENTGQKMEEEGGRISGADNKLVSLGFTSAETEAALAKLQPATHDVGKSTELLGVAADLARARNLSLGAATGLLVQVEAGRMKGLNKLGIATKDATGKTLTAEQAIKNLSVLFGGSASKFAESYEGKLQVLHATVNQLQVSLGNTLIPVLTSMASVGIIAGTGLNALDSGLHHVGTSLGGVIAGVATLGGSVLLNAYRTHQAAGANDDAAHAVDNLKKAQAAYQDDLARGDSTSQQALEHRKAYTDAQAKAKTITDGLTSATAGETVAQANAAKATKAAAEAAKKAEDALKKETSAILGTRDAALGLDNAQLGVADSIDTYTQKAKDAQAWGGKNAAANRDWQKSSNDVKGAIDGVAASAETQAEKQAELHDKTLSAVDSAKAQRDALLKLRDSIAPSSPFRSYLDGLIADLDRAARPRTETLHVSAPIVVFNPQTGVFHSAGVTQFADGGYVPGPVGAAVPAIVHGGEYVTRAQDVGRGRGGVTNNYAITVQVAPGADPSATGKAVVNAIRAYEKRNGTSWRA